MQCSCGGYVKTKSQPIVRKKKAVGVAELDVCTACGRNGRPVRVYSVDEMGHKDSLVFEGNS